MLLNRNAQAPLPFFALQLIALMIFFVVVLTLIAMAKNLSFTIDEFDAQSNFIMANRRIISSADCFASETRALVIDENGITQVGYQTYPGVLDTGKIEDLDYFNCLRKDIYDNYKDFMSTAASETSQHTWDAEAGSGASFRYAVYVYDAITGKSLYDPTSTYSFMMRADKTEGDCTDFLSFVCEHFGDDWECMDSCSDSQTEEGSPMEFTCASGRCEYQSGPWYQATGTAVIPYWDVSYPRYTVFGTQVILPSEQYQTFYWLQEASRSPSGSYSDDFAITTLTCEGSETKYQSIMPVTLKYDYGTHPGILIFESCIIQGISYDGKTVLDDLTTKKLGDVI